MAVEGGSAEVGWEHARNVSLSSVVCPAGGGSWGRDAALLARGGKLQMATSGGRLPWGKRSVAGCSRGGQAWSQGPELPSSAHRPEPVA